MAKRLAGGRDISGVLVLDKRKGQTSSGAVQQVKHLFKAKKVGHTGSLDPLATGVLPLCFGNATKFSQYLLDADKSYEVVVKLGIRTNTGDAEGEVIQERSAEHISTTLVEEHLSQLRGDQEQVPPMYSALKHEGKPLYRLARKGIEVERKARPITVYECHLVDFTDDLATIRMRCSKGTYVRTLVDDLGESLGCGAHVDALKRTGAGSFDLAEAHTVDDLFDAKRAGKLDDLLLPTSHIVSDWPAISLSPVSAFYLRQGQAVVVRHDQEPTAWLRLHEETNQFSKDGAFLGIGEVLGDGRVAPRRLVR